MIELLTKLGEVLKEVPEFAIWIMLGLLVYKIIIVGSYFGLIKLFIIKLHDWLTAKRTRPIEKVFDLNGKFYTHDNAHIQFRGLVERCIGIHYSSDSTGVERMSAKDVAWIQSAISQKLKEDNRND